MPTRLRSSFVVGALVAAALALSSCGPDAAGTSDRPVPSSAPARSAASMPLSVQERRTLLRMREEEKLAHDLYQLLARTSGDPRFTRIAASEERHAAAVGRLLERYGVEDPAAGNAPGEFRSLELQQLYDRLARAGSASRSAALRQGVTVERLDIADIGAALPTVAHADIRQVLEALRAGSARHLTAFSRV